MSCPFRSIDKANLASSVGQYSVQTTEAVNKGAFLSVSLAAVAISGCSSKCSKYQPLSEREHGKPPSGCCRSLSSILSGHFCFPSGNFCFAPKTSSCSAPSVRGGGERFPVFPLSSLDVFRVRGSCQVIFRQTHARSKCILFWEGARRRCYFCELIPMDCLELPHAHARSKCSRACCKK